MAAPSTWFRVENDPADWFSAEEIDRSRRYQRPLKRLRLLRMGFGLAVVSWFVFGEIGPAVVESVGVRGWAAELLVIVLALDMLALVYNVPLDVWVDLRHDREWGLSTQTGRGLAIDTGKSFVLNLVVTAALLVPLWAIIRATDLWWFYGWVVVLLFSVVLGFLFPVVIAPIFNKFTPLADDDLSARIARIAERAGVDVEGAFVADESKRSTRDNAYVAGLGATRRVVLFDTLLEHPPEVVEQVVAHEIGHWRLRHLRKQIPVAAVTSFLVFVGLRFLAEWDWLLDAAGADPIEGFGDPVALPVVLVGVQAGFGVLGLVSAWVSRAFERQADLQALELLRDPDRLIDMHRRLHVKNLADLDPGTLKRLQASHPPAAERMTMAQAWTG